MSLMSIFSKSLPAIGVIEFDAKLEGVTSKAIQMTRYPVEFGAPMNEHAIILPDRYLLTGAISNTPLGLGLNDVGMMGAGALATVVGGVGGAAISAVSAYLLSGSDETRAGTAWKALTAMLKNRMPVELITEFDHFEELMVVRLDQRTTPENEDGLIFIIEFEEARRGTVMLGQGVTSADQLLKNDPIATQGAPMIHTGDAAVEVMP